MTETAATAVRKPRDPELLPGYRLERLVGQGGMGEVHRAVQLSLGRVVAVKLLAGELAQDPTFVARFEKEAAALAALSHPSIVSIVDKGQAAGTYYLVMEYVDGPSLREVMRSPLLDSIQALRMMLEICRAIDYAHGRGVVHRDLKPENILFDQQAGSIAKVSDFGLAAFLDEKSNKFNMTEAHVAMGTLHYMAPEQRVDAKNADHRADIYALGVLLYEALVGEVPVGNFDPPSQRKPGLDARLDAIIARCLKTNPQDRYQKVSELVAELEPLVPAATELPRPVTTLERLKLGARAALRSATRALAVALVTAAALAIGVLIYRVKHPPAPKPWTGLRLAELAGPTVPSTISGDSSHTAERRRYTFGDGRDTLPVVSSGRPAVVTQEGLDFPYAKDEPLGRAMLDVNLSPDDGVGLLFSARVTVERPPRTLWRSLEEAISQRRATPRAALLLLGAPGRYVAVVVSATGEPLALEWGLGERRGAMLGPAGPPEGHPVELTLSISEAGELRASWAGEHLLGEPIQLGPAWKSLFRQAPLPTVGCVDGTCHMSALTMDITLAKPPPPAPAPAPLPPPIVAKATVHRAPPSAAPAHHSLATPGKSASHKSGTEKVTSTKRH
jgi:hypothetical protein